MPSQIRAERPPWQNLLPRALVSLHHFFELLLIQHAPFEEGIRPIQARVGAAGSVLTLDSEVAAAGYRLRYSTRC